MNMTARNTLTLQGTIVRLIHGLERISEVVKNRKAQGWWLLMPDEEWSFNSQWDERTCPICQGYAQRAIFRGDELPKEFPDMTRLSETTFKPNVHHTHPEMLGECRCLLVMLHVSDTLDDRLDDEKVAAN